MAEQRIVTIDASHPDFQRKFLDPEMPPLCWFCGKLEQEVKHLHRGPVAFICNECVTICFEIQNEDADATAS
jgi:ClpX C4-type zinc finger protein